MNEIRVYTCGLRSKSMRNDCRTMGATSSRRINRPVTSRRPTIERSSTKLRSAAAAPITKLQHNEMIITHLVITST